MLLPWIGWPSVRIGSALRYVRHRVRAAPWAFLYLVLAAEGLQSKDSLNVSLFDQRVPVIDILGIDLVIVDFVSAGVE